MTAKRMLILFCVLALLTGCATAHVWWNPLSWFNHAQEAVADKATHAPPGAAASWSLFRYMGVMLFTAAFLMLLAGIVGAIFLPILAALVAPGSKFLIYALMVGAVPFVLEWTTTTAKLPIQIALYVAIGIGALAMLWKLWQLRGLHIAVKQADKATALGQGGLAQELNQKASAIERKVKSLLPKGRKAVT